MKGCRLLISVVVFCALSYASAKESNRQGKVFSLFSIVTFKNDPCVSDEDAASGASTTYRNGTCMTVDECEDKNGRSSGNCASGFGVCCVISKDECGATVDQNATYIRNPNFPGQLTELQTCSYTINKFDNEVCWIRLDFDLFTLAGPLTVSTTDVPSTEGVCTDKMEVTSTTGNKYPTICGENTGQHIYIELGDSEEDDSATLTFMFDEVNFPSLNRRWEIKALQIGCFSEMAPPSGCLQWETGVTGRFSTFNYQDVNGVHLADQDYSYCMRQEYGHCCVMYQVCPGEADGFTLDGTYDPAIDIMSDADSTCINDFIGIEGATAQCSQSTGANMQQKFCGNVFAFGSAADLTNGVVCDCTAPFGISVVTNNVEETKSFDNTGVSNRGNCLDWVQMPCNC